MNQWPNVSDLQLTQLTQAGLYESYYFRANSPDGQQAIWIKHNILQFCGKNNIIIELWIIYYSKNIPNPIVIKHDIKLSFDEYCQSLMYKTNDLNNFHFADSTCFSQVSHQKLCGNLTDQKNSAQWQLDLSRSSMMFYHLDPAMLYKIGFPKKKILTADCHITLNGKLTINQQEIDLKNWHGIIGHNWGKEHAHLYLYASCNMFLEDKQAHFDGFSAKIKIAGLTTPFLSCAGLYTNDHWYHFTKITKALKHKVTQYNERLWEIEYLSEKYKMFVKVEEKLKGFESEKMWAQLPYYHPSGKISNIKSSKLTDCQIVLTEIKTNKAIAHLTSHAAELETCIPC